MSTSENPAGPSLQKNDKITESREVYAQADADKLWKCALTILDSGSQEQQQSIINDLGGFHSLLHAWAVFVPKISSFSDNTQLLCVEKFLRVLTHPLLADKHVMHVRFCGQNGGKGFVLLYNMCQKLLTVSEESDRTTGEQLQGMVDIVLKTLLQLLIKFGLARSFERMPQLLRNLDDLVDSVAIEAPAKDVESFRTRLNTIKRFVDSIVDRGGVTA
ncbi:nfx1-type zinc finger-containing 1 [Fusarium sporotrichioides]|uniref:Nfx1-type zinc finger-containing 1 n=1 Tax=Fusarium sporotrichioides TaxID=5514 RepID=A0A395S1Q1_FUSSP|nr:nfx1-type zinc finger-containing 1 [Fusarium sporotrichioides]